MNNPTLVKGTRDIYGLELKQKNYVLDIIKSTFDKYGFEPLETPAMENLSTLTGKYGEEGDRLIYKILNSGDFLNKSDKTAYEEDNSNKFSISISNKALRYDLTIPFARFVSQNKNTLNFPYKRYQTQSVWRADRPQKGRYREFFQCDADCVGSESIWQEIEFIHIYDEVFDQLNLPTTLHLNNRKVLYGIAESLGIESQFKDFTIALDKLDKIGKEGVNKELLGKGFKQAIVEKLDFLFDQSLKTDEVLFKIKALVSKNSLAQKGLEELDFVLNHFEANSIKKLKIKLDFTLARGLDYYTGCIFEIKVAKATVGSVGAGGRYSNLTEIFGVPDLPGIGISFGLDRVMIAMNELGVLPDLSSAKEKYLFLNFSDENTVVSYPILQKMRNEGYEVELYPEPVKLKKQFQFAERKNMQFVVFCGEEELKRSVLNIKNIKTGAQKEISIKDL